MEAILLILFYLFFPAVIIYFSEKFTIIEKIGTVVIAYIFGLILGNSGLISPESKVIQDTVAFITIPLALPLLLFSSDIKAWIKLAPKTLLATLLAIIGLVAIIIIGNSYFSDKIPEVWKVSGMLVGVYTGGTPNLGSIKTALEVDETTYILVHTYDTIVSAVFILFLITIGQRFFLLFLRPFENKQKPKISSEQTDSEQKTYSRLLKKPSFLPMLAAMGISILIMAVGGGISMIVPEKISTAIAILLITTLGIVASLIPAVNKIETTFHLGMYLILVFCLDVASMADLSSLTIDSLYLLYYVAIAVFGTLTLQAILSRIFKIDADTTIIISTTLICSPPFVPVVAGALKNKQVIISGLTVGVLGFAIGNYLGILLAWWLE